jgi:nucleoside-diphosphate-sugar epimerase
MNRREGPALASEPHLDDAKRVLVTGCAGFIGSHLAESCLARGWEVIGVDCLTPYYSPEIKRSNLALAAANPSFTYVEDSLLELDLPELLAGVDIVFHLAAQAGVRASWGQSFDTYTDLNITTLQRLLETARTVPLERFVFASSSSVYGDAERLPTPEDTVLRPVSPYGATKALGEHLAHVYTRNYGVPIVSLRYFTVYGPRQRPDMAFHRAIEAGLAGTPFGLFGDGNQTRDFTYVEDAVAGTVAAGLQGRNGSVYNLGGGSRVSMNEVLDTIGDLVGRPLDIERSESQRGDARDTAADTSRARAELGFAPSRTLQEGLAQQVEWHRTRQQAGQPEAVA